MVLRKRQKMLLKGASPLEIRSINAQIAAAATAVATVEKLLTESHAHLAVIIAQLRSISLDAVTAIRKWQTLTQQSIASYTPSSSRKLPPPPPSFMWQGTNYLLRMKTDNDFFDQSDILTEWYERKNGAGSWALTDTSFLCVRAGSASTRRTATCSSCPRPGWTCSGPSPTAARNSRRTLGRVARRRPR